MFSVLKNIITREHSDLLASIIRSQPIKEGDESVPDSFSYSNLPEVNILLGLLCHKMSEASGKTLLPTYSYSRVYNHGSELKKHKDRPSCEWSITINLSQDTKWPIFMNGTELNLEVGDGCIYQGCIIEHWRPQFTGKEYIQIFLHYVDSNGPYRIHWYDRENQKSNNIKCIFSYMKPNNTYLWWKAPSLFNPVECKRIINLFKTDLEVGTVGNGELRETTRKSKVSWIPKTREYEWIYLKIFDAIGCANDNFFNLKIDEIKEDIQFSQYDEQGHYDWHVDVSSSNNRKISASLQLTDPSEYDGGELEFDYGETVDKTQGTLIIFPSYMRHRVAPVTRGTRYSLVTWVYGPPLQ